MPWEVKVSPTSPALAFTLRHKMSPLLLKEYYFFINFLQKSSLKLTIKEKIKIREDTSEDKQKYT